MENQIEIYQGTDGQTQIEVKFEQETVWLSQDQMALLFDKDSDTISFHLKNISRIKNWMKLQLKMNPQLFN